VATTLQQGIAMRITVGRSIRVLALAGVVVLLGDTLTASAVAGSGWTHLRFNQQVETAQGGQTESTVLDAWTKGQDVVVATTRGAEISDVTSCRSGTYVSSSRSGRVDRIGYGQDCVRWAKGSFLPDFRDAVLTMPAASRRDLGGGIARYDLPDGSSVDIGRDGIAVALRRADGTVFSWERVAGGSAEPVADFPPTSSWDRYERVDATVIAPRVKLGEVPKVLIGLALDDTVVFSTSSGIVSAHVSWGGQGKDVELVVSAGVAPLADVAAGMTVSNDGASLMLIDGTDVVQVIGPDRATVVSAAKELRSDWGYLASQAGP
jgi:hypothetical protein